MQELRISFFGNSGVGKTEIISRFLGASFDPQYEPTIEDRYTKEATVSGRYVWLKILDTQGLEQFHTMRKDYANNSDAYVLVYDVTKESSVHELEILCNQLVSLKSAMVPMVIVGAKSDQLVHFSSNQVTKLARKLANRLGKPHILSSAKDGQGVNEVFRIVLTEYQKYALANQRSNNFDTQSISSVDSWLHTPTECVKARQQPTLKGSLLKLKKSISHLKSTKSMRNIRKVVSSASFYKSNHGAKTSASTATLRPGMKQPKAAHIDDNVEPGIEPVTENQLESVLEFDDVHDSSSKANGICSLMWGPSYIYTHFQLNTCYAPDEVYP